MDERRNGMDNFPQQHEACVVKLSGYEILIFVIPETIKKSTTARLQQ